METITLSLGSLQTNCYLVFDKETKETIIIDPADEGQFIIQKILDLKLKPLAIIATHGHFDHVLAVTELRLTLNIPFLMPQADLFLLKSVESRSKYWTGLKADPPIMPDHFLEDGDTLSINNGLQVIKGNNSKFVIRNSIFDILSTAGHTPGSICLYSKKNGILFSGDTLFKEGIGRTDYSYSSKKDMARSLKEKIFSLPENTVVYPGHGEETSIGSEKNMPLR